MYANLIVVDGSSGGENRDFCNEMSGLNKFIRDTFPETLIDLFDVILFASIFLYLAAQLLKLFVAKRTRNKIR